MLTKAEAIKSSACAVAAFCVLLMILSLGFKMFPSASIEVRFIQVESDTVSNGITPNYYGRKLTAIYLSSDIDENMNNSGETAMVWVNPQCNDDIGNCDISNAKHVITDYFDLTSAEQATEEINAQHRRIRTGSYRYVRMEFCKGTYQVPAAAFQAENMEQPYEFAYSGCTVDSQRIELPEVRRGDHVVVEIRYSLDNTVSTEYGSWCTTDNDPKYCFNIPAFDIAMYM